jgi:tRNA modification GTPase
MWSTSELIVAPATAAGAGGRGIVRIAGEGLETLLATLFRPVGAGFAATGGRPRLVAATLARPGLAMDWGDLPVDVVHWPGPQGPTGGPLAEVQLPASHLLSAAVVAEACRHGARPARGGEFSLRAFLAGRLDLLQAEAVLAVVDATTPAELSVALDALAGGAGREVRGLRESLLDLAADMEAAIDFADETTPDAVPVGDAAARAGLDRRIARAAVEIGGIAVRLAGRDSTGSADVPRVVLAGPPNVGKSSLFNRLVDRDAALVADEPGTTRDWIAARLDAHAGEPACLLVDVAGVETDEGPAEDGVARHADALARGEIARAAVVVACRDAGDAERDPATRRRSAAAGRRIDVLTRCDVAAASQETAAEDAAAIRTSSRTGQGIAALRRAILDAVAILPAGPTPATARMAAGLSAALAAVVAARAAADEAVAAACVRRAVAAIDEVTGGELGPDLIDRVFSRHCIGK